MTTTTYELALSFFPLKSSAFYYTVHRRALGQNEPSIPGTRILPHDEVAADSEVKPDRGRYLVSTSTSNALTPYRCFSWANADLTLDVLAQALIARGSSEALQGKLLPPAKHFSRHISFVLAKHPEGTQVVWLRPYALRLTGEFGFLADFSFEAADGAKPTKRLLELSLSQKAGRPNRDYYVDHYQRLNTFVHEYGRFVSELELHDGTSVSIGFELKKLRGQTLRERIYLLGKDVEVQSPFQGLRRHEPLKRAASAAKLVFLFQESDRPRSQELFRALRGDLFPTFPGMAPLFACPIDKNNVSGMPIAGFSHADLVAASKALKDRFGKSLIVPIALVPFAKHRSIEDTNGYFTAKHAFLEQGLASQFINAERFDDKESMKWSISNIALAVFAKMGGYPWKVKATTQRCLIVGIGQAHRKVGDVIKKYLAYSVLTDSSGLYEKIHVLGSSQDEQDYLQKLRSNLREVLLSHKDSFDSFVIHATFSIRRQELDAIKDILVAIEKAEGRGKEFAALKFNDKNDFFAYSNATNSKVPYESTVLKISSRDFLIWFDGLNQRNPTVSRRPERPVHVNVLYPETGVSEDTLIRFLQDTVNIAGANWRGFNARSMPISVYYAKLIADYYGHFQELGLSDIALEDITPWFL